MIPKRLPSLSFPTVLLLASTLLANADFTAASVNPAPDAKSICTDTPLHITFSAPPVLGHSGRIIVTRVKDGKVADVLDLSQDHFTNAFGVKTLNYEPVRIEGSSATVQLHAGALHPATEYSVTVEPGVFQSADGASLRSLPAPWQFTTREALPKTLTRLEVAPDSLGDFCTLQGAVDYIPEDNYTPFEIHVRNGTYDSITYLGPGRNRIRIVGEDRHKTKIAGRNNDRLNPGRMMRPLLNVDSDDVTIENLTVQNTTPYRGSQSEALRMAGNRCTARNCDFLSFQDTLLLNGRIYVADCYVEGDVDFIWGHGVVFFENCELKAMHDGYYVTSRNPPDQFGFVFSNCTLTAAPGVKKCWLARIATDRFPGSAVAFLNCRMGDHVPAAGWQIRGEDTANLRFYEFHSTTLTGQPLDVSGRNPASRQITAADAAKLSDPGEFLACRDTWTPRQ